MSDAPMVITVLVWLAICFASALVGCLVWFAIRVVAQLDRLESLVIGEMHKLDVRITKLESWRGGRDSRIQPGD